MARLILTLFGVPVVPEVKTTYAKLLSLCGRSWSSSCLPFFVNDLIWQKATSAARLSMSLGSSHGLRSTKITVPTQPGSRPLPFRRRLRIHWSVRTTVHEKSQHCDDKIDGLTEIQ